MNKNLFLANSRVSERCEQTSEWPSTTVLQSVFLAVIDHSDREIRLRKITEERENKARQMNRELRVKWRRDFRTVEEQSGLMYELFLSLIIWHVIRGTLTVIGTELVKTTYISKLFSVLPFF